jgi:hypothetical protein
VHRCERPAPEPHPRAPRPPAAPEDQPFKAWHKDRQALYAKRVADLTRQGRNPNRIPFAPITIGIVVIIAGLRWRRLDRDNKRASLAAATPASTTPTS